MPAKELIQYEKVYKRKTRTEHMKPVKIKDKTKDTKAVGEQIDV